VIAVVSPKVSLVVVPFNTRSTIGRVLGELERSECADLELVLVDNYSSDGTWEEIAEWERQSQRPHRVLRGDPDHCFAKAVNRGVAVCSGELVAIVNDDVSITDPSWLHLLVETLVAHPDLAAAGPTLLEADGQTVQSGGLQGSFHAYFRSPLTGRPYRDAPQRTQKVRSLVGAALLFRREPFVALGGYDEAFCPILFEDTDMLWRLERYGAGIAWAPQSSLIHLGGVSFGRDPSVTSQNRIRWTCRHTARSILVNAPISALLGELAFLAIVILVYYRLRGLRGLLDAAQWNLARLEETISRRKRFRALVGTWAHTT